MLHRLCGPPSIPLSFSLAAVLPRRGTCRVSLATEGLDPPRGECPSFTAWTTRVSNPVRSPRFRASASDSSPAGRLRLWCSSGSLRIPPLHREFYLPLLHSSLTVPDAVPRLSPGLSQPAYQAAYTRFTPNNSEQRLHPLYYRGCWHRVSRCFFSRYRQAAGC